MPNGYENIGDMGKDILKEIGSIGTGNAATSMSGLLNISVKITLPEVSILTFGEAMYYIGNPEEPVIAVMSNMSGEMDGVMLLIVRLDFASAMTEAIMGKKLNNYSEVDEISFSAITEVGNIVISSYLAALSELTQMDIALSVPVGTINMLGGVLNVPMVEIGYDTDKIMLVTGKFILGTEQHEGCLLMVPRIESLERLLKKLGG